VLSVNIIIKYGNLKIWGKKWENNSGVYILQVFKKKKRETGIFFKLGKDGVGNNFNYFEEYTPLEYMQLKIIYGAETCLLSPPQNSIKQAQYQG